MPEQKLLVGKIGAAHGIKGSVRIASYTEDPLAIAAYGPLETSRPGLTVTIADAKLQKATVIARLKGVSDRTAAEKLNGVELFLTRDRLPEVEDEDDFYHADLLGLQARTVGGESLGEVIGVQNFGAGDLLEVRGEAGETVLYPFTKAVVPEVRVAEGFVTVVPPEVSAVTDEDLARIDDELDKESRDTDDDRP